jgi:hypothetical protein
LTSKVLTSELFVAVSADTADLVRLLLFFASATWAAAWEAGNFPAVCRVRRGAATLDGSLRDVAGASLSLPTVESETYSSTGGGGAACTSSTQRTVAALVFVAQRCRAPVDAFTVLHGKTYIHRVKSKDVYSKNLRSKKN